MTEIADTVTRLRAIMAGTAEASQPVPFDPRSEDFSIAISRIRLEREHQIFPGITLRPTYAYIFAHAMLAANAPPRPHASSPAPWHGVIGASVGEVVHAELYVSACADVEANERVSLARNIITFLRLIAGAPILGPAITNVPCSDLQTVNTSAIVSRFEPQLNWAIEDVRIAPSDVGNLQLMLRNLKGLRTEDHFTAALALADGVWWLPFLSAQMIAIWSAAETLMRPSRMDMTKELARSIRKYLGQSRGDGDRLYQDVIRLCASRGSAAHVGREPPAEDVHASYLVLRGLLLRSLLDGEAPPERENMVPLWNE